MKNEKPINIDCDNVTLIAIASSDVPANLTLTHGNEYILEANCYANAASSVFASFDVSDTWELYIGRQYQSNASPVVAITDASKWNQVADWASANVAAGMICVKANVNGTALSTDLGSASSKKYQMEIWAVNNTSRVSVLDVDITINNAVQK